MFDKYTKIIFIFFLIGIQNITAQIPVGYYNGTENLSGDELKTALYNIIKGHTEFPYTSTNTDVWDILKETDKDTVNPDNVILLYTGWTVNAAQEYNNETGWNREHVWAKSHGDFGTEIGPGTDVHAIRPCDITVNTARWNYDFAAGGDIYIDGDGETECRKTSNSWEPRDEVKGDVARMIFYMATRYEGENNEPDLEIVDYVESSLNYQPLHGKLSDLYKWHLQDTVSDWEINRNNIIYNQFQGNRNPYIDHPEFVEKIWGQLVSTEIIETPDQVTISPNPFRENIKIELHIPNFKTATIKVFDIFGKTLINFKSDSTTINIPGAELSHGIYILEVTHLNQTLTRKMLIKNN
jgi:endonuclease I